MTTGETMYMGSINLFQMYLIVIPNVSQLFRTGGKHGPPAIENPSSQVVQSTKEDLRHASEVVAQLGSQGQVSKMFLAP